MMRRFISLSRTLAWCLCAAACLSNLSCGQKKVLRDDLVPVAGTVTFKGQPLANATVMLIPTVKEVTDRPAAVTDADGAFELACADQDGAPPGSYQVTIVAFEPSTDDEVRPASRIPEKYSNPKTSGLKAVVQEEDENVIDFTLTP